jgi:hypothetical protein
VVVREEEEEGVMEEGLGDGGDPVESPTSARMDATGMGSCQAVLSTCIWYRAKHTQCNTGLFSHSRLRKFGHDPVSCWSGLS